MKRRTFLAGMAAATLAHPALLRAAEGKAVLRFIPDIDLSILDPHTTTAYITRVHGLMVFDTLYGVDENFKAQPQMVDMHTISDDGHVWTLSLRPGLLWHDGAPVLARDCVASVKRWAKRDLWGAELMAVTEEISAPDEKTIIFRLKRQFPLLPEALGKCSGNIAVMMPERLALTDALTPVQDMIGSGPFRYIASERVPGSLNVYEKFESYVPRPGPQASWTAGGKTVHFDRVEWTTIPDSATAVNALLAGEQDYCDWAPLDLLPLMRSNAQVTVSVPDPTGWLEMMRPNHLQPPFNNPAIRRALWGAINQKTFMQAVNTDPTMYKLPLGFFGNDTPFASNAGLEPLTGPRDLEKVKQDLKDAGYKGETVVLLVPTDFPTTKAMADVAADMMRNIGMNIDYVATDWANLLQRRTNKGPVEHGGWSVFFTTFPGVDWSNPASHIALRGSGEAGYVGWATSPKLEQLRQDWLAAPDLAHQKAVAEDIQRQAMEDVPFWPLGQRYQPTAIRNDRLSGVNQGFPTFWNIKPA